VTNREVQRRARAVLTAGALLLLTVSGHTAGGGGVDVLGLAIVTVLSAGLAISTTTRSLSLPRLLAVLVAGQVLLHLVLTFTAGHAAHGSAALPLGAMVAGHAAAALVAALVVRHADALIARWIAFVSTVLGPRPGAVVMVPAAPTSLTAPAVRALVRLQGLLHQVVRRGPPAGTLLLLPA
jgi:hypothetical protein